VRGGVHRNRNTKHGEEGRRSMGRFGSHHCLRPRYFHLQGSVLSLIANNFVTIFSLFAIQIMCLSHQICDLYIHRKCISVARTKATLFKKRRQWSEKKPPVLTSQVPTLQGSIQLALVSV